MYICLKAFVNLHHTVCLKYLWTQSHETNDWTESKYIFNIRQINGKKRAASIQNKHSASKIKFENVKGQTIGEKSQAIVSFETQTLLFKSGNTLKPLLYYEKAVLTYVCFALNNSFQTNAEWFCYISDTLLAYIFIFTLTTAVLHTG